MMNSDFLGPEFSKFLDRCQKILNVCMAVCVLLILFGIGTILWRYFI